MDDDLDLASVDSGSSQNQLDTFENRISRGLRCRQHLGGELGGRFRCSDGRIDFEHDVGEGATDVGGQTCGHVADASSDRFSGTKQSHESQ